MRPARAHFVDLSHGFDSAKELLTKPYYGDISDTRFLEGKTWLAPEACIREDVSELTVRPSSRIDLALQQKSLYFPNITGKSLDQGVKKNTTTLCYGKISIISMLNTKISEVSLYLSSYWQQLIHI